MIKLHSGRVIYAGGRPVQAAADAAGREKTMAYGIMRTHGGGDGGVLRLKFDSLISHDITYVGVIQTAKASGLAAFPVPYAMTNCHNSLCAVGGTINEDDHIFGLSAARKYGGIYVPANMAVIHQYARETLAGCGKMILGSDSHTRFGALGAMGVGEGGPEIVKQLLGDRYELTAPEVVLAYLTGAPRRGVGPHDVAIALCGAVYKNGFVKNKVLEFAGPGVKNLSMDYRIGIDVMTTETACLSSVWQTDGAVEEYLAVHGRAGDYKAMEPGEGAAYDGMIEIDLSAVEPMIALPFHPSEAYTIRELRENPGDILRECEKRAEKQFGGKVKLNLTHKVKDGVITVDQGVIAGCAGGMYDNIAEAAAILRGGDTGNGYFSLSVYPSSVPVNLELIKNGVQAELLEAGAVFKPCFCGPCFGAGDVPGNGCLSIRHTTRNFPNREGSRPGDGQLSGVALMDARSIAATARNHGALTPADEVDYELPAPAKREFDGTVYAKRVYNGYGKPDGDVQLRFGPNIAEWPAIPPMPEDISMELACVIHDPVTTTDELIPSGETSSYRSNPMKLASFALSRRDPEYVGRARKIKDAGGASCIFAECPGDGSAREQAASCQRVLGGAANICRKFATKRYRSNCINWGMLPLTIDQGAPFDFAPGDRVEIPGARRAVESGADELRGYINGREYAFNIGPLTKEEREILLAGCLMNWYAEKRK
jgi:aconitate hydratase